MTREEFEKLKHGDQVIALINSGNQKISAYTKGEMYVFKNRPSDADYNDDWLHTQTDNFGSTTNAMNYKHFDRLQFQIDYNKMLEDE